VRAPRRGVRPRERLGLPVEVIVRDLNRFLRGWVRYFRHGNSTRDFDKIRLNALNRLSLFVARRHQRPPAWGWWLVVYQTPDHLGLLDLSGSVIAPRPIWGWQERPNAGAEKTSVGRLRENRMPGSTGAGGNRHQPAQAARCWRLPPTRPTSSSLFARG
jgi:hypothetical protein